MTVTSSGRGGDTSLPGGAGDPCSAGQAVRARVAQATVLARPRALPAGTARRALVAVLAALVALLAALASRPALAGASMRPPGIPPAAAPAGGPGCDVVHLGPAVAQAGRNGSYLSLDLARGSTGELALAIANPQGYACEVELLPAYGATAVNGGDTYVPVPAMASCQGASCWMAGLPVTLPVPAHARLIERFRVAVPRGAGGGDYLAGVIGEPAAAPVAAAPGGGESQQGVAAASVVARVAIGLAVTVPGPLVARLSVQVLLSTSATLPPSLEVVLSNRGNAWAHPAGRVEVVLPTRTTSVAVEASTVLPGGRAEIDVPVGEVPPGEHLVTVELPYGHRKSAIWRGTIDFPAASASAASRPGTETLVITASTTPAWVTALIAALVGALLALGLLAVLVLRSPRSGAHRRTASAG